MYSSVVVRIFAFESNDNCSWPYRMIFNNSSFEGFIKGALKRKFLLIQINGTVE